MNPVKAIIISGALALAPLAANAASYTFSYTFDATDIVTGSFNATLNGSSFENLSNITVNYNGTEFSNEPLFVVNGTTFDNSATPAVSTDGALNNFFFSDSANPLNGDYTNYFNLVGGVQGGVVNTNPNAVLNSAAFDGGTGAWAVAAVPEPGTYALLLAGLGLVGAIARRSRKA